MKRIITHAKADGDAIAAAWLAATYLFPGEKVEIDFVPRVRPGGPGLNADCLVDISCVHDPKRLIFDHKPPACADRNATCATRLVWEHLLSLGRRVGHLEALVRIVHEGDRSPPGRPSPELAGSRSEGFHFHLKQARARNSGDPQLYQEMRGWLDRYDRDEHARCELMNRDEQARCEPRRKSSPNGQRTMRADATSLNASGEFDHSQAATSISPGTAKAKRSVRTLSAVTAVVSREPNPSTGDDGLRSLETLLLEHGCTAGGMKPPEPVSQADSAEHAIAMRKVIADLLTRSEPGSRVVKFLQGLRVLVEMEIIAPGYLADRRSEADGWLSSLSLAKGTPGWKASESVALEYGIETETLGEEVKFAEAVEVITRNCGVSAFRLLLTPGGRLREKVIRSIARKGPERQRYAMAEAAQGRDPLARPVEGVWPMDTRNFAKVPGRLGRARGAVKSGMAAIPALLDRQRPSTEEVAALRRHSTRIIECSEQLLRVVEERGTSETLDGVRVEAECERSPKPDMDAGPRRKPKTFAQVRGKLDAAQYFVEKTGMDVPRLPPDMRPTRERASQIQGQLRLLIDRTRCLSEAIETTSSR